MRRLFSSTAPGRGNSEVPLTAVDSISTSAPSEKNVTVLVSARALQAIVISRRDNARVQFMGKLLSHK
jgi:hypothetical protein